MIQEEKGQTPHTGKRSLVFSGFLPGGLAGYAVCAWWLQKIGYARVRGCVAVWYGASCGTGSGGA